MEIRPGEHADLVALNDLYNHYIRETAITFDIEPITMDARREWFAGFDGRRFRLLVAVEDDRLLGFAGTKSFRPKQAYETSVESTVYLAPEATGRGLGKQLYGNLFDAIAGEDVHRVYAGITVPNEASFALHRTFGFSQVALFSEQGRKFGKYWDVAWFEKHL